MNRLRHRRWWLVCVVPCLACGLAGAVLVDRAALVTVLVAGALAGALSAVVHRDWATRPGHRLVPAGVLRHATTGAIVMTGALSLVVLLGAVGLLIVVAGVLTSPFVIDLVHRGLAPASVRHLSDLDLCRAWGESTHRLSCGPRAQVAELVARRGQYLDELRRRDEDAFGSWVGLGGGAGDALAFYFLSGARGLPRRPGGVRSRGSAPDGG